jgi:DNA-directed RNA polymerase beta subunit
MAVLSDVIAQNEFSVLDTPKATPVKAKAVPPVLSEDSPVPTRMSYTDYDQMREYIYNRTANAVRKRFPISNEKYTLLATDLKYDGDSLPPISEQKEAIFQNKSLTRKLRGRLTLRDNQTGQVVGTTGRKTIMAVPAMTNRGTFIRNGVEYSVAKQFRLVPNIYTRNTDDGMVESQFNVKQGSGVNFRIYMEPETSLFYMRMAGRKIPLYPVLSRMGVKDEELEKTWGKQILAINSKQRVPAHLFNWVTKVTDREALLAERDDKHEAIQEMQKTGAGDETASTTDNLIDKDRQQLALRNYFERMELNPNATMKTVGKAFPIVTPEAMIAATGKIIRVSRGEDSADDRDSLAFQSVHDVGDFLEEKIQKDQNRVLANHLWKITNKQGKLDSLPPGFLNKHVDYIFNKAGVAQPIEEINPIDMLNQSTRVIRLGEGALPSTDAAPKESRNVQPSYLGFVDPVKAPECYAADMDVMTLHGWKPWPTVTDKDMFLVLDGTKLDFKLASKVVSYEYSGVMHGGKNGDISFLVTPDHRMWVKPCDNSSAYTFTLIKDMQGKDCTFKSDVNEVRLFSQEYFTEEYTGKVYCATVPGGLLYVRRHGKPGIWCGNSLKIGLDMFFARGVQKGSDNLLYKEFINPKTGKREWVNSIQATESIIAFPEALTSKDRYVPALVEAKGVFYVPREKVNFVLESGDDMFSTVSDTVPLKSGIKGMRLLMGCLASDTAITVKRLDGTQITLPVSEYVHAEGDSIRSIDENNNCSIWRPIRGVRVNDLRIPRKRISISSGRSLVTTLNHTWVVFNSANTLSKIITADLRKGMEVPVEYSPDYVLPSAWDKSSVDKDKIIGIEDVVPEDFTFDLDVDDSTFMCANGIYVHNSKFVTQALPLLNREAPYVQTKGHSGKGVMEELGSVMGAVYSKQDGKVLAVYKDRMKVQYADGTDEMVPLYDNFISSPTSEEMYNEFPLARKTALHNTPTVKAGQEVKKGDVLAYSNFTDKQGVAAPGVNLTTAYMNYYGKNFEDAVVISQSAANKLTSEMLYKSAFNMEEGRTTDPKKYKGLFPTKFKQEQLDTLDENGVIKPGTIVRNGDPLIIGVTEKIPSMASLGRRSNTDSSVVWQHHAPGVVIGSAKTKDGWNVFTKTYAPMEVGDKLAIPYGGKGVVADIIPDDRMLKDGKGNPVDLLVSPLSVPSRTNSAQMVAAMLGKVAAKTGKGYVLPGFMDDSHLDFVKNELRKNNLTDTEDLYDPESDKTIPGIFLGNMYAYKMQQTSESKGKARATASYTQDETPSRGGKEGSKHIGQMELEAFLAHGAFENLKDMKLIRGQKNDDFWRQLKLGKTPTVPGTPFVYGKFKSLLQAGGINLREENDSDHIFGMTNQQVKDLTGNRRIQNNKTFSAFSLKPIEGGLFDPQATGSLDDGNRTAYIPVPEPLLNPVMEGPIRSLLGLTQKKLDAIISGDTGYNGKVGGEALKEMLADISLPKVVAQAKTEIKEGARSKRDAAIKRYRYAQAMLDNDTKPVDFMMDRILVLPPKYRPISKQGEMTMVNDMNHMYKALMDTVEDYADSKDLPEEMKSPIRKNMYDAYKAVIGLADPTQQKLQQKNIGGVFKQLFGTGSAKQSFVQRRLIGADVDMSGLGVVVPNPALKLNEAGLPLEKAWDLYEPFIVRNLVMKGVPAMEAAKAVEKRTKPALSSLQEVVKQRPVIVNRAPTLHKYSMMAFWPVLTKGNTLQVSPTIVKPLGMDFDGNCLDFDSKILVKVSKSDLQSFLSDTNLILVSRSMNEQGKGKEEQCQTQVS